MYGTDWSEERKARKGIDTQDIASCQAELNKVNQRLKNNLIHQVQAFVGHSKAMQNQDKLAKILQKSRCF